MAMFAINKRMVVLMVVVAAALVPTTLAVKYVVGDDAGWTNKGVDYRAWTAGKMFYVGDILVFNYAAGNHNVMKVNRTEFLTCTKPLVGPPPLTSGKDEIPLLTAGKKGYICGATGHCDAVLIVAAATTLVPVTLAEQYVVGDGYGWSNRGVDYSVWVEGKRFFVGDSLVFKYMYGNHNVFKVNETEFRSCLKPLDGPPPLMSGNDEVWLLTPGKKWYICGAAGHCAAGQKLVITVSEAVASPAPTPN
ncbi:Blue copper protein [Linum grandiflorum]